MIKIYFLAAMTAAAFAAPALNASKPTVEVMLNAQSAKKNGLGTLESAVVVSPTHFLMIEDQTRFYQVAWGGIRPIDGLRGLSAFEYSPDGGFVGIRGKNLVSLVKEKGVMKKVLELPSSGMGLASGAGKMYLYERAGGEKNGLYALLPAMKAVKLLESPEPIGAVQEAGDDVLFAAGSAVYRFSADKKTSLLIGLPKGKIVSLARNPQTRRIYASDGASVFSFDDDGKNVVVITRESGGVLRWFGDGLIVFDPKAPLLMRIRGAP